MKKTPAYCFILLSFCIILGSCSNPSGGGSGDSASAVSASGVTLNKSSVILYTGGITTETLTATVSPGGSTNKTVAWETSNPGVATVTDGIIEATGEGTATITVTTNDGSHKATCDVIVAGANYIINNTTDWYNYTNLIKTGSNSKVYILTINNNDISVPGFTSSSYTFGTVQDLIVVLWGSGGLSLSG